MSDMISITNFKKSYGEIEAVKGIDLQVKAGEVFGLIGPDGAGKTTLMRAVCTLLAPDEGEIKVAGRDVTRHIAETRTILGYMPQRFSLYQDLTVEQNLNFFAELFQVPEQEKESRLRQLYHFSRLEPFRNREAGALSGGMKQKLALSCALIHTPEVLVLDEPTFGVDPVSRKEFWDILRSIRQEGTTILVSTAYMDEADQCDRVALAFRGKIVATDTPAALKQDYPFPLFELHGDDLRQLRDYFTPLPGVHNTQMFGDSLHVSFGSEPETAQWEEWTQALGGSLSRRERIAPTIEDVFLSLMETSQ